jgi:hypothetical protein
MDPVAGTINVAAPDALKAEQDIAVELRPDLAQLIRKSDDRFCAQARDQSKGPFIFRPFPCANKLDGVCRFGYSTRESF